MSILNIRNQYKHTQSTTHAINIINVHRTTTHGSPPVRAAVAGRVEDGVPKRSVQTSIGSQPQAKARLGRAGTRAGAYAIDMFQSVCIVLPDTLAHNFGTKPSIVIVDTIAIDTVSII